MCVCLSNIVCVCVFVCVCVQTSASYDIHYLQTSGQALAVVLLAVVDQVLVCLQDYNNDMGRIPDYTSGGRAGPARLG